MRLGDARKLAHIADAQRRRHPHLAAVPRHLRLRRSSTSAASAGSASTRAASPTTEIGARRKSRDAENALADWQRDVDAFVAEFARVLKRGALAFVAIGDSAVGTRAIAGDAAIRAAAERAKLHVIANAAEERPNFYRHAGGETRREHLLLITNVKTAV